MAVKVGDLTLDAENQKKVTALGDAWTAANAAGDKAGMEAARAAAEAIRNAAGYSTNADGTGYNKLQTPQAAAPAMAMPTPVDNSQKIGATYDAQLAAQIASLNAARDQANSDYGQQINDAPAQFQPARDQADIGAARNMQRANETAAAKGTAFSGGVASDQGAIVANADTQKTALTQQEINLVQNLKKAIADNNKATSYKEIEMSATTTAQKNMALIDESNRIYNAQYQQSRDMVGDKQWGQQFDFTKERAAVGDQQWGQQFDFTKEQAAVQNDQWKQSFDFTKERAAVQDGQWLKAFQADQANAAAGRAIQWAGLSLDKAKFEESKKGVIDAANISKFGRTVLGEAMDMISATKKGSDDRLNVVDIPAYSREQVVTRVVMDPDLSEAEQNAILAILGINKGPR